jgi:hypothetical protein
MWLDVWAILVCLLALFHGSFALSFSQPSAQGLDVFSSIQDQGLSAFAPAGAGAGSSNPAQSQRSSPSLGRIGSAKRLRGAELVEVGVGRSIGAVARPPTDDAKKEASHKTSGKAWYSKIDVHVVGVGLYTSIFVGLFLFFVYWATSLFLAHRSYSRKLEESNKKAGYSHRATDGFQAFLNYKFEVWLETTDDANTKIIFLVTLLTMLVGATFYSICTGHDLLWSSWKVFVWLVAPDAGVAESDVMGYFIGGVMSVCGLMIFALLLMLMQDGFNTFTEGLKGGRSAPVVENGHYLLVGFSMQTIIVIEELCTAYADSKGTVIVIISSSVSKQSMEEQFASARVDLRGSRVVFRCCRSHSVSDLKHVAAHTAKTIVLFPDRGVEKELRDAFMLRTLMTLRSQGWPTHGMILVVLSLPRNFNLFKRIGGDVTHVAMLDSFLSKMIVQCTKQPGTGAILNEVFGFSGSEFYIVPVPAHLEGLTFEDATGFYPGAVLTGILETKDMSECALQNTGFLDVLQSDNTPRDSATPREAEATRCNFCPGVNFILKKGQELVLIAEDQKSTLATAKMEVKIKTYTSPRSTAPSSQIGSPRAAGDSSLIASSREAEAAALTRETSALSEILSAGSDRLAPDSAGTGIVRKRSSRMKGLQPETIIMLGWNAHCGMIMLELDANVPPGSEVYVLATMPGEERAKLLEVAQSRWRKKLKNIVNIHHFTGSINSLDMLPTPIEEASRILVLSDNPHVGRAHAMAEADAHGIAAIMQIRASIRAGGKPADIPIVLEIRDSLTEHRCKDAHVSDYINTSRLPSVLLAAVAYQPRIRFVLREIISEDGRAGIIVRKMTHYIGNLAMPKKVNFAEVCSLVAAEGDVCIGWSRTKDNASLGDFTDRAPTMNEFHEQMGAIAMEAHASRRCYDYEVNPMDKISSRPWTYLDRLVVISVA